MALLVNFIRDNRGATAIEYALIAGLISIVIVVAVSSIGKNLNGKFQNIAGALN